MQEPHHAPPGAPKKPNIHRRIVSYGLLLVLGSIAYAVLIANRYEIHFTGSPVSLVRYDRWNGQVTRLFEAGEWKKF